MSETIWEDVVVPKGAYISWGNQIGQFVQGKVVDFSLTGGSYYDGTVCPQLSVELTEPAASIDKEGVRTNFDAGEFVVLNCGQVSLRRAVKAADPKVGDLIKIVLKELVKTTNGTVKEFAIQIARIGGKTAVQPEQFQQKTPTQVQNPFQPVPTQAPF